MTYIISNQATCKKCGDTIFSAHQHHFVGCSCKAVYEDGGQAYFRRMGKLENFIEQSITAESIEALVPVVAAVEQAMETGRNPLGVALAAFRGIRDGKLTVDESNHWTKQKG